MHGYGSFLRIHTRAQHTGRTEQHPDFTLVHSIDKVFALLIIFRFLNKPHFVCRYAVVFYELAFDFGVHIPFARLIGSQIGEHELRSFLCVELFVILGDVCRTMRSLIVRMVFIYPAYQTHIKRHLTGIVRSNEHLCFFFPLG